MDRLLSRGRVIAVIAVIGAAAVLAFAARPAFMKPTVVVTVNLPVVMEGLEARVRSEADLYQMAESITDEDESRKADLEAMQQQFKDWPEDDDAGRDALRDELVLKSLEFEQWRKLSYQKLDIQKSLLYRELYRSMKASLAELCGQNGYDIAILNDSEANLVINPEAQIPRAEQVRSQMTARSVLYVNPSVDVTDQLIARMNNEFKAGQ